MPKKLLAIVIATFFMLNLFATSIFAATAPGVTVTPAVGDANTNTGNTGTVNTPDSGLTPTDPLYGLKVLSEKVNLILTDDPQKQAVLYAQYAMERLSEAKLLADLTDEQKADLLKKLTDEYAQNIQKAQELLKQALAAGANIRELVVKIDQAQNVCGLEIVLNNVPEGVKDEIKLNLLNNLEKMEAIKTLIEQKGIEMEDEDEDDSSKVVLGESISTFVHAVNDAREEVHKAVAAKAKTLEKSEQKDAAKNLQAIEKQFKAELRQISREVKTEMVKIAKGKGTDAEIKAALDQAVQKGLEKVKAAKEKALSAIEKGQNSPAAQAPLVTVAGQQTRIIVKGEDKQKYQKEIKEKKERGKKNKNEGEDDGEE